MQSARRRTLTDDVYESVRTLIMDHAIAPGDRVNIDALARQLQVSPTPVREALARLESDGLVRKRPLAGYTAAPLLTRDEFEELVEMRLVLEAAAARRAAARMADRGKPAGDEPAGDESAGDESAGDESAGDESAGDESAGERSAVDLLELRREADLPGPTPDTDGYAQIAAFTAQDARFHNRLAELSGNRMLHEAVVRLRPHLHLFRLHFPITHYGTSAREHHRIVDAVAAGDPEGAEAAMRAHLLAARERHLPYFTEEG